MKTIRAYFDGKVLIPVEPVTDLPINVPLIIRVEPLQPADSLTGKEVAMSDFAGLWADREDIGDSLEFARKLRKQAETRRHQIDE